ncbi:MAG: hypothetical protein J6V27_03705 [Alistipes sp.]|nr:hypothetical protein [Alistipes sp.]
MERFFRNIFLSVRMLLVLGLSFLGVAFTACTEDGTEDGFGPNGYKIIGTPTNKDGAANVQCDGRAQSISLVFNVADDYVITTDGSEWLTIESGTEGLAGKSRGLKLMVAKHESDQFRTASIYITIGDNPRCRLATVMQTAISIDAMVKWMDERLENEYYWLDKYCELKESNQINYDLTGKEFLTDALTGKKWGLGNAKVNKDDGYMTDNGWHLFSYLYQYSATKAPTRAQLATGFGFELCYTIIAHEGSPYYTFLIEHIYPNSPAYEAGFERGDEIEQVNGQYINDRNFETLFYALQAPSSNTVSVGRKEYNAQGESKIVTYNLTLGSYEESPIAYSGLLKENVEYGFDFQGKKIGYISYLGFESAYDINLIQALKDLSKAGVTDMIVDLRNNGGGEVFSSSYFASMLLSEELSGQDMVILKRNAKNEYGDSNIKFVSEVEVAANQVEQLPHLNMQSVYFITSGNTASASEMLIMGLRAQGIEAKTIGKQTMGKDCGMDVMTVKYGASYYEFAPITFMNLFPNYDVNFAEGIPADINFNTLMLQVTDTNMKEALRWFPMPEIGANWGNYLVDPALGEAVANILGGTIFSTASAQGKAFDMPRLKATRSAQSRASKAATIFKPEVPGMYLRSNRIVELEKNK